MSDLDQEFRLEEWRIRPRLAELEGPEGAVRVEPKAMAVLAALTRRAGEVCSRQELLDAVWGDAFVTEEVLSHCVWSLRKVLGDDPKRPRFIQTVPRQGYCLVAKVSWLAAGVGDTGRYRLLEAVGSGAMGEVWKAEDSRLHRTVALKFLPAAFSRDPAAKKRLLREARAAAALDHANICTLHDADETADGRLFLVMAWYPGETLRAHLERGPLPTAEAVAVAADVAAGLAVAHGAGITHRDVKPGNLLLGADGVRILDFGLATYAEATRITQAGTSPGTPAYMAPEQIQGAEGGPASDLWSLGVVLYEMLAGRLPFEGANAQATMYAIVHYALPALPPTVHDRLRSIVERCLEKDPDARDPDARSVHRALVAAQGEPAASPGSSKARPAAVGAPRQGSAAADDVGAPISASRIPKRPARRGRLLAIAAAVALAALLAAWLSLRGGTAPAALKVAVLPAAVVDTGGTGAADGLAGTALAAQAAVLDGLSALEAVTPIEPDATAGSGATASQIARAVAADEVIRIRVAGPAAGAGHIALRRLDHHGAVLWSHTFDVSIEPAAARQVYDSTRLHFARAYPDRKAVRAAEPPEARDADYAAFLAIARRIEEGASGDLSADLAALEAIVARSPRFLAAHLLAADVARSLYTAGRASDVLDRGLAAAAAAERLAPADPRPLVARHQLLAAARRHAEAGEALAVLEQIAPADPQLPVLRAHRADDDGDAATAIRLMEQAVAQWPSWQRRHRLADLALRHGRPTLARAQLDALLAQSPANTWGLAKLAELELLYGDLARAEALYARLTALPAPKLGDLINHGLVHLLAGRPRSAVEQLRRARTLAPEHPTVLVDLADAELAVGHAESAHRIYAQALEVLSGPSLSVADGMLRAQCLVRLGRRHEAVRTTQEALRQAPDDAEAAFQASLVYALAGERASAVVNAERALSLGVQPIWFDLPAFAALADDPAFAALLAAAKADAARNPA